MKTSIERRRALITGAGSGIGRAVAQRLSELGCDVVLVGRTGATLNETAALCPGATKTVTCDLTDESSILALVGYIRATGGLDILVNNAGIVQSGPLEGISTEEFDAVMATNVRAPFILMRETLPLLKASPSPEIINVCSVVAHEVFEDGVRVHLISPGGVLTDMVAKVRPEIAGTPMILPEDVADAAEYLLTHRSDAVCDEIRLHRATKAPF